MPLPAAAAAAAAVFCFAAFRLQEFYMTCDNAFDSQGHPQCPAEVRFCPNKSPTDYRDSPHCIPYRPDDPIPAGYEPVQPQG